MVAANAGVEQTRPSRRMRAVRFMPRSWGKHTAGREIGDLCRRDENAARKSRRKFCEGGRGRLGQCGEKARPLSCECELSGLELSEECALARRKTALPHGEPVEVGDRSTRTVRVHHDADDVRTG